MGRGAGSRGEESAAGDRSLENSSKRNPSRGKPSTRLSVLTTSLVITKQSGAGAAPADWRWDAGAVADRSSANGHGAGEERPGTTTSRGWHHYTPSHGTTWKRHRQITLMPIQANRERIRAQSRTRTKPGNSRTSFRKIRPTASQPTIGPFSRAVAR